MGDIGTCMTEVAIAESKLRDAKRIACHAFVSRTESLQLLRAKQTGRILAINRHTKSLEDVRAELQTLKCDSKYGNIDSYVTDERVDDFLGQMMLKHKLEQAAARFENLERTQSPAEMWDAQVQHLEPHHTGTLAVLNYASGNIDENFRIDPERCKCGRIYHFNATLSMNFCTVHKVYYPILSADDKSTRKAKPNPGNYTDKSKNVRQHIGKTHRLVITSENQICAANNILYKAQLESSQERVARSTKELRIKLVKKEQAIQKQKTTKPKDKPKPQKAQPRQQKNLKNSTALVVHVAKPPNTKSKPKEPKKRSTKTPSTTTPTTTKKTNQTTIETTLAKQAARLTLHTTTTTTSVLTTTTTTSSSKRKQAQQVPTTTKLTHTSQQQPLQKKQELQLHKNTTNYERYLLQFAPDAQEITSEMLQQIHSVVSTVTIFGEARCLQEITTLVETSSAFCDVRAHVQRILKLSRAQPVPVIDTALRQRLIARFREVQGVLSSWQQDSATGADGEASSKSRRRFAPCNESLTHVFLLGEKEWHLASAFAAHSTLKVELDYVQRFRELIQTVARSSTFVWKYDFDLIVDNHNNRHMS